MMNKPYVVVGTLYNTQYICIRTMLWTSTSTLISLSDRISVTGLSSQFPRNRSAVMGLYLIVYQLNLTLWLWKSNSRMTE